MITAYLGIGSNLGNRLENMRSAAKQIESKVGNIITKSSIYETTPWGFISDKLFFNAVIKIETNLNEMDLLEVCNAIEYKSGRKIKSSSAGYTNRPLDIDILFYGKKQINTELLTIPQANIENRRFVLEPLNEIGSSIKHPLFNKTIKQLLEECKDNSQISKTNNLW